MEIERRVTKNTELRLEGDTKPKITGYAAIFDVWTDIGGMFKERVLRGAFSKTIKEGDVRGLWNHDANYVLGRNKAGTLSLEEDKKGLRYEINPPDTQWARDLMVSIDRGDVDQSSYGFKVVQSDDNYDDYTRTIKETTLFDVSPVTYPAEASTTSEIRSLFKKEDKREADEHAEKLESLLTKLRSGDELSSDDLSLLRSFLPTSEPDETTLNKEPIIDHSIEPGNIHSDDTKPVERHSVDATAVILGQFEQIKLKTKKE